MRLTIVVADRMIRMDDESYLEIDADWSWVPENVHAVQWYDTWGEIEFIEKNGPNEKIYELGVFSKAIEIHQKEKQRIIEEQEKEKYDWEWNRDWSNLIREYRNYKLSESDWSQISDNSLTEQQKERWRIYRQELRDLPAIISEEKYRELVLDFEQTQDHLLWPSKPT